MPENQNPETDHDHDDDCAACEEVEYAEYRKRALGNEGDSEKSGEDENLPEMDEDTDRMMHFGAMCAMGATPEQRRDMVEDAQRARERNRRDDE